MTLALDQCSDGIENVKGWEVGRLKGDVLSQRELAIGVGDWSQVDSQCSARPSLMAEVVPGVDLRSGRREMPFPGRFGGLNGMEG